MRPRQANRMARSLAVEESLDAAIEIDEIVRGKRQDAPAFEKLIRSLIGSPAHELSAVKKELLSDSRLTSLYYRAARSSGKLGDSADAFDRILELLLSVNWSDFSKISREDLVRVRDFCIGINQELVSEAFSRTPEPPLSRNRQNRLASANAC